MKHIWEIQMFQANPSFESSRECADSVPPVVYAECKHRWPQFFERGRHSMHVRLDIDDPIIQDVIEFLRQHGREPHLKRFPSAPYGHPTIYTVRGERVFEKADLVAAEYFKIFPRKEIGFGGRKDGTDFIEIEGSRINKQPIGMPAAGNQPICTDDLRKEMEAQNFVGLSFRDVFITGRKRSPARLWQLWSDRLMPPLLNRMVDEDGNDCVPEKGRGCYVDDFYIPALLKFSGAGVQAMEPFDAALTRERFGSAAGPYLDESPLNLLQPELIVSRRFRSWCEKRRLKIEWHPVSVE